MAAQGKHRPALFIGAASEGPPWGGLKPLIRLSFFVTAECGVWVTPGENNARSHFTACYSARRVRTLRSRKRAWPNPGGSRMKKFLIAGIAAAAFCGAPALAADMPTKGPVYKAEPLFNWTGFYVGGNVGYGWGGSAEKDPATGVGVAAIHAKGPAAGGQFGVNYQMGQV